MTSAMLSDPHGGQRQRGDPKRSFSVEFILATQTRAPDAPPPRRHTFTPHTVQSNPRTLHFTILIQISAARTRPRPGCSVFSSTIPPLSSSSEKKKPMPVSPLAKISVCFFSLRLHQSLSEALLLADAHVSVCFLRLQTSKPPFFFLDTVVSVCLTDSSQVL